MDLVSMSLIRMNAVCKECNHQFIFYNLSDFDYGKKLGRTSDPLEIGLLDCIRDPICEDLGTMLDNILIDKNEWQRLNCLDKLLGQVCDFSPSNHPYDFTGQIYCTSCGSNNVSYGETKPLEVEVIDLHLVTHNSWDEMAMSQKQTYIRQKLRTGDCS